jgi:phosphatidylserine decarboxylase
MPVFVKISSSMKSKRLALALQYLAPQRALTWFAGWLSSRRWVWFKTWQINFLINRYGANPSEAVNSDLASYPDFTSFFTRHLKPELRPVAAASNIIVSPVDGCISQIGDIKNDVVFQAKGFDYTLNGLFGGASDLAQLFTNGKFATIYLAPKDYHRVHIPAQGTLRETIYIPGKLFSVSAQTVSGIPQLFTRNERLVCVFDTEVGPMAVIFVGAMLVGNIITAWSKAPASASIKRLSYHMASPLVFPKAAELGYFTMGSTVILLFPHDKIAWQTDLNEGNSLKMGQPLAEILPS